MSNSCSNSVSGDQGSAQTPAQRDWDLVRLIAEGGDGFAKRFDALKQAKRDADEARAAAQAAEVHAQSEVQRIRDFCADIKAAAEKEAAEIVARAKSIEAEAKAKIRSIRLELERFKP